MRRFSRLWWASIALSSVVVGGGTFAGLSLATGLSLEYVLLLTLLAVITGDVVLALLSESVSPTQVKLGPGERRSRGEQPGEVGRVIADFRHGRGDVTIFGERWSARQEQECVVRLEAGDNVRVLEREGLTLVVARI